MDFCVWWGSQVIGFRRLRRDTLDGWLGSQVEDLPTAETRVIAIGHDSRWGRGWGLVSKAFLFFLWSC